MKFEIKVIVYLYNVMVELEGPYLSDLVLGGDGREICETLLLRVRNVKFAPLERAGGKGSGRKL